MKEFAAQWAMGYFPRNYTDVFQGLLFGCITLLLAFKAADGRTKIRKFILSFLVSYNTAQMISSFLYPLIGRYFDFSGTLWDFIVASACLLIPVFPMASLYRRVLGVKGPVAVFIYTLFFNANCMAMVVAMTTVQRLCITAGLSVFLTWIFRKDIRYIITQESMLRTDKRFSGTAVAFMILIGAEAEVPRIVINGGRDTVGNQLAYAVAIVGAALVIMFVIFMKFNFFAIMQYENYIRKNDDDQTTCAKSFTYLLGHSAALIRKNSDAGRSMAVFYTDIENLRDVNVVHGYDAGNDILQRIASCLTEAFPGGIIARASGTHFTGIVPFSGSKNDFEKIISYTERLSIDETLVIKVGVRPLGSMSYNDVNKVNYKYLISMIDQAASAIKYIQGPRSGILYYDEELELNEKIRTYVLANVDKAVRNQWLKVYYQPIVDCSTGETAEYEALSRWTDPQYGFLTPDKFIVPLENVRMIYKVDLNVLRSFGREVEKMEAMGRKALPISFNISRTDLEAEVDIFKEIERVMTDMKIPKDLVHVELTESALNGSSSVMSRAVDRLHEMGLEVWMDDFGSGYSSLNVLKDYYFDVIKIDMEFMRKFDPRSKTIVRSICEMAGSLGMKTVAEGVETQEQYDFLKSVGCTYAQGYLFSKPLPAEEIYA